MTLPVDGPYVAVVNPATTGTGTATVQLFAVVDGMGALTVNGSPVGVTLAAPGQAAALTFAGTAGQSVTVRVTGNTVAGGGGYAQVSLVRPTGTVQATVGSFGASFTPAPQTLATPGTYTVRVDPTSWATGSLSVQVTSP